MAGPPQNLSGWWAGVYSYPNATNATPFEAELRDHGGLLSGLITESGDAPWTAGMTLTSTLVGDVQGTSVHFIKTYDDPVQAHQVIYDGALIEDGEAIEGNWTIIDEWSGPFRMERRSATKAEAIEQAEPAEVI